MLDLQTSAAMLQDVDCCLSYGKVSKVAGLIAEGRGVSAPLGSVCELLAENERGKTELIPAEVVGFNDGGCLFMPYSDMRGIRPGSLIKNVSSPPVIPVSADMLGRAVDAFPWTTKAPLRLRPTPRFSTNRPTPWSARASMNRWTWAYGPSTHC
jgi:flagellum-specific ATP synthase